MIFKNSFFCINVKNNNNDTVTAEITVRPKFKHRIHEWHNCHNEDLMSAVFTQLKDCMNDSGFVGETKNDAFHIETINEHVEAIKSIVEANINKLNDILDV